jgi:histidine triad (HIT) family protein
LKKDQTSGPTFKNFNDNQGAPMTKDTMFTKYDKDNIFARILRKEIQCKEVLETAHTLAFHDAFPLAPVHVLIIPKKAYITADDFFDHATADEILDWSRAIAQVVRIVDVMESGYRLVTNARKEGGQVVPHFHLHVLGKANFDAFNPQK